MLYSEIIAVCSQLHTKHIKTLCGQNVECTNLTLMQKGVLYSGSRIYNNLPSHIKRLSNDFKQFKNKLKAYLLEHSYYSLGEFYQTTSDHHK